MVLILHGEQFPVQPRLIRSRSTPKNYWLQFCSSYVSRPWTDTRCLGLWEARRLHTLACLADGQTLDVWGFKRPAVSVLLRVLPMDRHSMFGALSGPPSPYSSVSRWWTDTRCLGLWVPAVSISILGQTNAHTSSSFLGIYPFSTEKSGTYIHQVQCSYSLATKICGKIRKKIWNWSNIYFLMFDDNIQLWVFRNSFCYIYLFSTQ